MGRVFDGVGDNRFFRFKIDPVLRVGNPARPLQQRLDTAFLDRVAIAVKELLSKVVYGLIMRRRDPGVLHLRI